MSARQACRIVSALSVVLLLRGAGFPVLLPLPPAEATAAKLAAPATLAMPAALAMAAAPAMAATPATPGTAEQAPAAAAPGAEPAHAPPCSAPEYRQFDFWVGDWDAFDLDEHGRPAAAPVARNHVELILGGCVLREIYEATSGVVGQSFSIYDRSRQVWHQSWVTNRGTLLVIEGKLQGDRMVLSGTDPAFSPPRLVRGVWYRAEGGVRETADRSSDGGKTWQPWFDILFRRHPG
jgi:hypothetical protein